MTPFVGRSPARIGLPRLLRSALAALGLSGCIVTVGPQAGDGGPDGGPDALETVVTSGPSNGTTDDTATFFFTGSGPVAAFECQMDSESFAACVSPVTRTGVMPGAHVFSVRALDAVGSVDPTPAQWSWTMEQQGVDTIITQAPTGAVNTTDATVVFQGVGPVTGFECRLDNGAFASCTSPVNLMALQEGSHVFEVRALGAAGQVDNTPASASWTVFPPAPDTVAVSGPTGETNATSATFVFAGTGSFASFLCALDGALSTACTSPHVEDNLLPGLHTFAVAAVSAGGNQDLSPASWTWTVVEVGPPTQIDSFPVFTTSNTTVEFHFSSPDATATFECALDAAAFTPCTSPTSYSGLADGPHTFRVRAVDSMGVADPSPATETFTVDTIPPQVTITVRPAAVTASTIATVEFTANEEVSFQCSLDGGSFNFCSSPFTIQNLSEGNHTVTVMARDAAYNPSDAASVTWLVDLPATRMTQQPPVAVGAASVTFSFTSPNRANATFECSLDGAAFAACTSPFAINNLTDGVHDFKVRAVSGDGMDPSPARHLFARRGSGVIQLATGYDTGMMCALEASGRVWCFGDATGSTTPLVVPGPYRSISVASEGLGRVRLCGIRQDGGLECGTPGQTMTAVDQELNWLEISVQGAHACGLKTGNVLVCWGDSWSGALGLGQANTTVAVPTPVGTPGWTSVGTSYSGACGTRMDGTLWCWGSDWRDWSDPNWDIWTPAQLGTSQDWQRLATTGWTLCGWRTDGVLWCRGYLGGYYSLEPVDSRGVLNLSSHYGGTFVLDATGALGVAGGNGYGSNPILGHATAPDWMMNAVLFPGQRFLSVVTTGETVCAVPLAGELMCWGSNRYGLLGQGHAGGALVPTAVPGLQAASRVSVGGLSACSQSSTGDVARCWGQNSFGQLGTGDRFAVPAPTVLAPQGVTFAQVSMSGGGGCAVATNGSLWCWGSYATSGGGFDIRPAPVRLGTDSDWNHVETSGAVACATRMDRSLWCWGDNYDGGAGLGAGITQADAPTRTSLNDVTSFSVQGRTACAITMDGALYCWGDNFWGQTGIPSSDDVMVPTRVGTGTWQAVSASSETTCGVKTTGALHCWGLGGGEPDLYPVGSESNWRSVMSASSNQCAINATGQAYCWGSNLFGQAGVGTLGLVPQPTLVAGGHNWVSLGVGEDFACGVTITNTVMCWGSNHTGQLGDGHGVSYDPLPVQAP